MREGARRIVLSVAAGLILVTTATAAQPPLTRHSTPQPASASSTARYGPLPGLTAPGDVRSGPSVVAVTPRSPSSTPAFAPLKGLLQADLMIADPVPLSPAIADEVRNLPGVVAAQQVDAARISVNGKVTATLGVDPVQFRAFAAQPTADAAGLWQNVAAGGVAVSYTMGTLDKLPLNRPVQVTGRRNVKLPLAGFGTTGIAGVDAVVSDAVAQSLGIPVGNAIVVSAPHADLGQLMGQIRALLPAGAAIAPLVAQAASANGTTAPQVGIAASGPGLSPAEVIAFLKAAESRRGLPYVWGGSGPDVFDCSGLVQWSLAQAGVVMPRVAADQALTGPQVPVSQLQPGDLLFYHTDPTAPGYISHVAIYLGDGVMLQAPEPGLDVEAVPADFGQEFAGAIQVYPGVAASVAGASAA